MTYIEEYYELISTGKIPANKRVIKEYGKVVDIIKGKSDVYYYNDKLGTKPVEFAERFCKQSKDEWVGKPIQLLLWQKAFISAVFGIVEKGTDKRKYTDVFLLVAKKNGKTTVLAPIILYLLLQRGHYIYSAANSVQQALIVWNETANMLAQSDLLQGRLKKRQFEILNTQPKNFSKFRAVANNPSKLDGLLPTDVVLDEIHELYQSLYGILKRGQVSVSEPLFFMLTTKGFVREGLFDEQYKYACQLVDGSLQNEHQLSLLYEFDNPEEFNNEEMWIKANPSLGQILTIDKLRKQVESARGMPKLMNEVRTKHFNIGGATATGYFEYDAIHNEEKFDWKKYKGSYVIGSFDLSRTNDLTAFGTMVYDCKQKKYFFDAMYFISEDFYNKMVTNSKLAGSYQKWVADGYIRIAGKNIIDHKAIADYADEMVKKYGLIYRYIYYDSYAAPYLVEDFNSRGYRDGDCLTKCVQGYKTLSVPFQIMGAELNNKNIVYNDNPVTIWCLTNMAVDVDRNGNELPKKPDGKNEMKIDGEAAMLNCMVGMVEHKQEFIY